MKKLDSYKVKKFLTFARCSGKSFSIKQQAQKELALGKKVAIVCNWPLSYKCKELEGAKLFSLDAVMCDVLKFTNSIDPWDTWWKQYPKFQDFDFLYVDADCYEAIIQSLLQTLNEITSSVNKTEQLVRKSLDEIQSKTNKWR